MQFPELAPIKPINLPELKPIESKKQSLQEWHAAGGGVPKQYKGREHVWHAKVKKFAEGGEAHMGAGGVMKGLIGAYNKADKAADAAIAAKRALPAAERDANLQKFLEPSKAPMRLYHGTNATEGGKGTEAIRRIKPSKEGSLGSGVYLTPSSAHASGYSGIPNDEAIEMMLRNPLHQDVGLKALNQRNSGNVLPAQEGGNMLPVHAQIRNPLIIEGTHGDPMIEALMKLGMDETSASKMVERAYEQKGYIGKQVESRARAAGYDGLMQYRNGDLSEVVSYNPNAVKSAIGNQGTYDTSSPDLSKAKGGEVHMAGGGDPLDEFSPPRYRSAGRRPESQQDRKAAANMPMDFARGVVSGIGGAPGDIESLIRMLPGLDERTVLPTSEDIEKRIPLRSDTPAGRAAAGLGTLAGGFYMGPGAPIRLVGGLPQAVYKAGKDFSRAAGQPAANVIKPTGGNFLTGRTEKDLKPLKARGPTHRDEALLMGGRFAQMADDPENIRIMAQDAALNKWVDSNLTNYVKKQMGTPDDPVRKLAEEGITHRPALLENADLHPAVAEKLKKQRMQAGFPEEGMGNSPTARAWETASDNAIATHRAGDIQNMPEQYAKFQEAEQKIRSARQAVERKFRQQMANVGIEEQNMGMHFATSLDEKAKIVGDTDLAKANAEYKSLQSPMMESYIRLGKENPWISKVNPETPVYTSFTSDLGFDHIMDVLREDLTAGRIRPEQMNKISMSDAVRRTYQYDQELAAKMNASRAAAREGLPTYKEYPEGYRWVELNKPGSFAQESEAMGHSVRGYEPPKGHPDWSEGSGDAGSSGYGHGGWEAIKSGKAKVYSLVDSKGAPHATVEVGANRNQLRREDLLPFKEAALEEAKKLPNGYTSHDLNDIEIRMARENMPAFISQIKGKGNRAPNEEYLPYIQDFVKSGKWSDVGDIQNTGMRATSSVFSDAELRMLRERGETDIPHILSGEDIQRLHNTIMPEGKRLKYDAKGNIIGSDEGLAHGGAVRMAGGGAALGVFPQMKPRRSKQDPEAAKNVPLDLARGFVSGVLGAPGDIESFARLPYELITGKNSPTFLPTSEDIEKRLPFRSEAPVSRAASGAGQLAGGFYMGPGSPLRAIGALPEAIKHGAQEFAMASTKGIPKIFIGPKAKTWDQAKADAAARMEQSGVDPVEIWRQTGTFRGADGIPRQEISDVGAVFRNPNDLKELGKQKKQEALDLGMRMITPIYQKDMFPKALTEAKKPVREQVKRLKEEADELGRYSDVRGQRAKFVYDHPELYKAYPELGEVTVYQGGTGTMGEKASIRGAGNDLQMEITQKGLRGNPKSSILHEMQHGVQNFEGMAPGGNTLTAFQNPEANKILQDLRKAARTPMSFDEYFKKGQYSDDPETIARALDEYKDYADDVPSLAKQYDRDYQQRAAEEYYTRLAGEAEARAAQAREPMSASQRAVEFPYSSYDVLPENLIVKDPKGLMASMQMGPSNYKNVKTGDRLGDLTVGEKISNRGSISASGISNVLPGVRAVPMSSFEVTAPRDLFYAADDIKRVKELAEQIKQSGRIDPMIVGVDEKGNYIIEGAHRLGALNLLGAKEFPALIAIEDGVKGFAHGGPVKMSKGGAAKEIVEAGIKGVKKLLGMADEVPKGVEEIVVRTRNPALKTQKMGVPNVDFADPLLPPTMRLSEALGNAGAEGKTLNFTEADRSRVFGSNRGGVGFSGLQHYSLPHKKANTVWGFGNTGMAEKKIRQNDPKNSLWTTFVGSPTQHRSNSVVIGDAIKEFQKSVKQGVVPVEQIMLMNKRLNELTDPKTGAKVFESGFDLTDPSALSVANTFSRRAAVGDVMLGLGVKGPMSRLDFKKEFPNTKFVDASDIENILKRETDPDLVNAGTYDVGNRLFVLDGKIIQRPDLNEAFPVQVTGDDLGMKFGLVPPDTAMRDFYKAREGRLDKNKDPSPVSYYDLARAEPSQLVDENYLTYLQKAGYKKGGLAAATKS